MRKSLITFIIAFISTFCFATNNPDKESKANQEALFYFISGKNAFYFPWMNNNLTFKEAVSFLEAHKDRLKDGSLTIYVYGYCGTKGTVAQRKSRVKVMSNRVKSEFIYLNKASESNFVTTNSTEVYRPDITDAVLIKFLFKQDSVIKTPIAVQPAPQETQPAPQPIQEPEAPKVVKQEPAKAQPQVQVAEKKYYKWALRTNLLHWLSATPNIGAEWRPIQSFSVLLDVDYAPWTWANSTKFYRIMNFQPQIRYYTGFEHRCYIGGEFHAGQLNLKVGTKGHQGNYMGTGIVLGYQFPLNPSWQLDLNIGGGYTQYTYDKYETINGFLYRSHSNLKQNIWGISSAGLCLVWNICK